MKGNRKVEKNLKIKEVSKEKSNKKLTNSEEEEFESYLQKIEDPDYNGQDVSWHLSENATPVEKAKYELCEKILGYQQKKNLSDEEIANRIKLTIGETRDILYCHIDYFTLDRLVSYANRLFAPFRVKVIVESEKPEKHARAV